MIDVNIDLVIILFFWILFFWRFGIRFGMMDFIRVSYSFCILFLRAIVLAPPLIAKQFVES